MADRTMNRVLTGITPMRRATMLLLTGLLLLPACVSTSGCSDPAPTTAPTHMKVTLDGQSFNLELAIDEGTRTRGLGGRTELDADGGMLFSFKTSDLRYFVMRDCFIPIDIIFLDKDGRVTDTHAMTVEAPRGEGEGEIGDYQNRPYGLRLKRYSSRFSAKYAIELAGGTLEGLEIDGHEIRMDDIIKIDTDQLDRFTK